MSPSDTVAEPLTAAPHASATTTSPASNKPLLHHKMFPINVSYFSSARVTKEGEPFTSHEFSISAFRGKGEDGKSRWDSLSIRRSETPKLIAALERMYYESYQARPEEQHD